MQFQGDRSHRTEPCPRPASDARVYVITAGKTTLDVLRELAAGQWASMVIDPSEAAEILLLMKMLPPAD